MHPVDAPATEELVSLTEYAAAENPAQRDESRNHIWETVEVLARHPMAAARGASQGPGVVIPGTPFIVGYPHREERSLDPGGEHAAREWPEEF